MFDGDTYAGLEARKEHRPADNAVDVAARLGVELLSEEQYRALQQLGRFDAKNVGEGLCHRSSG